MAANPWDPTHPVTVPDRKQLTEWEQFRIHTYVVEQLGYGRCPNLKHAGFIEKAVQNYCKLALKSDINSFVNKINTDLFLRGSSFQLQIHRDDCPYNGPRYKDDDDDAWYFGLLCREEDDPLMPRQHVGGWTVSGPPKYCIRYWVMFDRSGFSFEYPTRKEVV